MLLCSEGKYLLLRKRSGHLSHLWRFPEAQQLGLLVSQLSDIQLIGRFSHAYLQTQEKIEVWAYNTHSLCHEWDSILSKQADNFEWLWAEDLSPFTLAGPYRKFLQKVFSNSTNTNNS